MDKVVAIPTALPQKLIRNYDCINCTTKNKNKTKSI